jgi:Cu(I)/Ag(I) efflux system membrane fusion protein
MKNIKSILVAVAVFAVAGMAGLLVGCKHMDSDEHSGAHLHTYTCTMHPEVVQNAPGNCPKCAMKLVHKD